MRWLPLLLLALVTLPARGELALRGIAPPVTGKAVVIDVRPAALCQTRSVAGARCLPAAEFLDGRGQLAPWREILWLFTTVRLDGRETVVVIGDEATDRRFVAGLLWLAGQRRVELIEQPVAALLAAGWRAGAGQARDFARRTAYIAAMREREIVMPGEVCPRGTVRLGDPRLALAHWVKARLTGRSIPVRLEATV